MKNSSRGMDLAGPVGGSFRIRRAGRQPEVGQEPTVSSVADANRSTVQLHETASEREIDALGERRLVRGDVSSRRREAGWKSLHWE